VRKHFLYVYRKRGKTKVENNFHNEQHSYKNSLQISAKQTFSASVKVLEIQLYYSQFEDYRAFCVQSKRWHENATAFTTTNQQSR
jgi:hypothetical protein